MNKENKNKVQHKTGASFTKTENKASNDMLPEIGHKFSSWTKEDQNLNELDELLMEHDLMAETSVGRKNNRSGISATIHVTRANGTSSPDHFDFEDVMDEFGDGIETGGVDLEQQRKNGNSGGGLRLQQEDSNSFDLDNSDDLNRFIQKYETMLDDDGKKKANTKPVGVRNDLKVQGKNGNGKQSQNTTAKELARDKSKDLDDSWGSLQLQAEQMLGVTIEDETSPTKFKSTSTKGVISPMSAAAQHKIEEEIIADELRLAHQQQQKSSKKKFGSRRRSSDINADMIEDFENNFDDDDEYRNDDAIDDEVEDEDALRMIDEEIMNTALGKADARKIKDLINKIDGGAPRTAEHFTEQKNVDLINNGSFSNKQKQVDQQLKFSSSSKVVVSKYSKSNSKKNLHENNSIFAGRKTPSSDAKHSGGKYEVEPEQQDEPVDDHLDPLGGNEDDIDEFIKRHLGEDETKKPVKSEEEKAQLLAKAKELLGENRMPNREEEADMFEESLSESDGSADMDGEQLTPKQALLNGLVRLGNPRSKKYSIAEREHFVSDLESILKVLTFKETVAFIFPVLDVYAAEEQDYLKIELFKQLPCVFKKLMKSPARPSDQDALDLLTVNIFPLISQILMTSDDQVQHEGVQALFKISEEYLPKDEAIFLAFNVVQLLTKKADQIENAKTAVLMLIEKFAEADYFTKKECMIFLNSSFKSFMEGALFKIKKQLLPCMLAISKQISYADFKGKILETYMAFSTDPIWGVRRVCIELLPGFLSKIAENETAELVAGLEFLKRSLRDESRWVKNQAFLQFGKVVHEVYLKSQKPGAQQQILQEKITEVSDCFLNLQLIAGHLGVSLNLEESKNNSDKKLSMSSNSQDEIDKIKECWAFNFPCVLLVNGGKAYWARKAKPVYIVLYKDILLNVRKSLAASLFEIARLIKLGDDLDENDDRTFLVEVANHFLADSKEIKMNLLPNLCDFIGLFPRENQKILLNTMIRERLEAEKDRSTRVIRVNLLIRMFEKFDAVELVEAGFHQYLYETIKTEQMVASRFEAANVFGKKVVAKLIKSKKYRKDLTDFVDELRKSTNFRNRQMYLWIAKAAFEEDQEIYKKHFAKAIGNDMCNEKVTVVKCMIMKLVKKVPSGYSKSTDKIGEQLKAQGVSEVNQFCSEDNADIRRRRYLDPAKITTQMKADLEDKSETEEAAEETKEERKAKEKRVGEIKDKLTAGEEEERKEISQVEKTVSIRLCNYSMLVRAQQFSSGLSAQLMALLGGYGSLLFGGQEEGGGKKMLDQEEENMLKDKKQNQEKKTAEASNQNEEEDEDDTW